MEEIYWLVANLGSPNQSGFPARGQQTGIKLGGYWDLTIWFSSNLGSNSVNLTSNAENNLHLLQIQLSLKEAEKKLNIRYTDLHYICCRQFV